MKPKENYLFTAMNHAEIDWNLWDETFIWQKITVKCITK